MSKWNKAQKAEIAAREQRDAVERRKQIVGLEKKLEKRCCDVAKAHGWWTRKFSSPSNRGVPDRIFVKDSEIKFIEFKAPGNKPTKLQAHEINELKKHGADAFWIDNINDFKARLRIHT